MSSSKFDLLQKRLPAEITFRSEVQLWENAVDIGGMMLSGGVIAPQNSKLKPDKFKAYVEFRLAHAFPVVSSYATSFHPSTLKNSFASMLNQQFNYGHLVRNYYKGKPEENTNREDRILGAIIAVDFPREPLGGWALTDSETAPGMHCVASIAKQAKGMDRVLGQHQSGRQDWTVSLEVDYQLAESGVVLIPTQQGENRKDLGGASRENAISEEDMSILAKHTPSDYQKSGLWYLPLIESSDEIVACFSPEKGMFNQPWKGHKLVMLMGGIDGSVQFKGTGLVQYGAEPAARIETIMAEDARLASMAKGFEKIGQTLDRFF